MALGITANAKPDGYHLVGCTGPGLVWVPHFQNVSYKLEDFVFVMHYGAPYTGLAVKADSPFKTLKDLVEYAKKNPGKVTYSTTGVGSPMHVSMEFVAKQESLEWTHIPYKGGHEATTAILGGHVEVEACSSEWKPYVESGRLRLLSTYNPNRLPKYPEVPTWVELGYKIAASGGVGVLGPKGIPPPVVDKIHGAYKQALDDPAFKKAMESYDMPIVYRDPEGLGKDTKELGEKWGQLIVELGIRQE